MKAILISDHAKWCALMMNGDKTVEVRKGTALYKATQKLIDEYGYAEFYVYCSKSNTQYLVGSKNKVCEIITKGANTRFSPSIDKYTGNGKVLFKFRCYKVEEILPRVYSVCTYPYTDTLDDYDLLEKSCLLTNELESYLGGNMGYAIHISHLEIFDKPKELSEFRYAVCPKTNCEYCEYNKTVEGDLYCTRKTLTKAPQSFCYIEVE